MVNNGSRCTIGKNNREAGPPSGNDPCHRNNNEKSRVLELWKYEVTKGALCVGIDVAQGWHCAASRGWSSSQDQMPKLGQGEERKRDRVGGLVILRYLKKTKTKEKVSHYLSFQQLKRNCKVYQVRLYHPLIYHCQAFLLYQKKTWPFHQTDNISSQ